MSNPGRMKRLGGDVCLAMGRAATGCLLALGLAVPLAGWAKPHKPPPVPVAEAQAAVPTFDIGPEPSWVGRVDVPALDDTPGASLQFALIDEQVKVDNSGSTHFHHSVRVLNDASSLGEGSQLQVVFDPLYQHLTFHRIEIWREGRRIDKLNPKSIQLLHRETQLERREYDGRETASIVLDDVRVGDRIEWSYSLSGDNPVFGGKYVAGDWTVDPAGPGNGLVSTDKCYTILKLLLYLTGYSKKGFFGLQVGFLTHKIQA